ncbi:MAG: hypothetical protein GY715_18660 [Planctomycetes bacterium]|nr:hypothetical protein [Planctomycetota bacterium]
MAEPTTDQIAREAARLVQTGAEPDIDRAIHAAAAGHDAPRPGHGLVREHAQGMAMQALGREGYAEQVRDVWRIAEEIMTVLERVVPDGELLLAGRAARGQIDGGVTIHVRVYTDQSIGEIAAALVEHGYEEPAFETARSRFGCLDRIRFVEACRDIVVTRCPAGLPAAARRRDRDLFQGRPIATATLEDLRKRL